MLHTLGEERGELRELRPPKKELADRACECMALGFAMAIASLQFPFSKSSQTLLLLLASLACVVD